MCRLNWQQLKRLNIVRPSAKILLLPIVSLLFGLVASSHAKEALFSKSSRMLEQLWSGVLGCHDPASAGFTPRDRYAPDDPPASAFNEPERRDYAECARQALRNKSSRVLVETIEDAVRHGGVLLLDKRFRLDSSISWVWDESVRGEADIVIPVWDGEYHNGTGSALFMQHGVVLWNGIEGSERIDAGSGLVFRSHLNADTVAGGSIFYDYDFKHAHERIGAGVDVQSGIIHIAANYYHPIKSWRAGRQGYEEQALQGADFGIGIALDRLRLNGTVGVWRFEGEFQQDKDDWRSSFDIEGGFRVLPGVFLEGGYEHHDDETSLGSRWNAGLAFRFSLPGLEGMAEGNALMAAPDLWRKVRREKRILYEERADVVPSVAVLGTVATVEEGDESFVATFAFDKPLAREVAIVFVPTSGSTADHEDYALSARTVVTPPEPLTPETREGEGGPASAAQTENSRGRLEMTLPQHTASLTLVIDVIDDEHGETHELIELAARATGENARHVHFHGVVQVTIPRNDDFTIGFADAASSVAEDAGTAHLLLQLGRTAPEEGVPVRVAATGATGDIVFASPADITVPAGTAEGRVVQSAASVAVDITDDAETEAAETVTFTLSEGDGFPASPWRIDPDAASHTLTILASDPVKGDVGFAPGNPASATEGDVLTLTVMSSAAADADLPMTWTVAPAGKVQTAAGTVTIANGSDSQTFSVNLNRDGVAGPAGSITVTLAAPDLPDGWSLGDEAAHAVAVMDADALLPSPGVTTFAQRIINFAAASASVNEGASVSTTLSVSPPPDEEVKIPVILPVDTDAHAITVAPAEALSNGGIVLNAGRPGVTFTLNALEEDGDTAGESVTVLLGSPLPGNYSVGGNGAWTVRIIDNDDPAPASSIGFLTAESTAAEGESVEIPFEVTHAGSIRDGFPVTIRAMDALSSAMVSPSQAVTLSQTSRSWQFTIPDDARIEDNGTVTFALTDEGLPPGWGVDSSRSMHTLTITDVPPLSAGKNTIGFAATRVPAEEGDEIMLNAVLKDPNGNLLAANGADAIAFDVSVVAGGDETSFSGASFVLPAYSTFTNGMHRIDTLRINDDTTAELEKTLTLSMTPGAGFSSTDWEIDASADSVDFIIAPSDNVVGMGWSNASFPREGGTLSIPVYANLASPRPISLAITAGGSATKDIDYTVDSQVVLPANTRVAYISVTALPDSVNEIDENIHLAISGTLPNGWIFGNTEANIRIPDDEEPANTIGFTSAELTVEEGDLDKTVSLPISASTPPDVPLSVTVRALPSSSIGHHQSFTVPVPQSGNADFGIAVDAENVPELTGVLVLGLFENTNDPLPAEWGIDASNNSFIITVPANDNTVSFAAAASTADESAGTHVVRVNADLAHPTEDIILYTSLGGTASNYAPVPGSFTIPAGSGGLDIPVTIMDDAVDESVNKTVILDIGGPLPNGWSFGTARHTVTIIDNDPAEITDNGPGDPGDSNDPDDSNGPVRLIEITGARSNSPLAGPGGITLSSATVSEPGAISVDVAVTDIENFTAATSEDVVLDVEMTVAGDPDIAPSHRNDPASANDYTIGELVLDSETGTGSFTFTIEDDDIAEGREIVTLALADPDENLPQGWKISDAAGSFTVTVPANDNAARFSEWPRSDPGSFAGLSAAVAEGGGNLPHLNILVDHIAPDSGLPLFLSVPDEHMEDIVLETFDSSRLSPAGGENVFSFRRNGNLNQAPNLAAGLQIRAVRDNEPELEETFDITLMEPAGFPREWGHVTNAPDAGTPELATSTIFSVTIPASDNTISLGGADRRIAESAGTYNIPVHANLASPVPVTLTVTTGGSATNGADYTVGSQIVLPANSTAENIAVAITPDTVLEPVEYIDLTIGGTLPEGWSFGTATRRITIIDDDEPNTIGFASSGRTIEETGEDRNFRAPILVSANPAAPLSVLAYTDDSSGAGTRGSVLVSISQAEGAGFDFGVNADSIPELDKTLVMVLAENRADPLPPGWRIDADNDRFIVTVPANDNIVSFADAGSTVVENVGTHNVRVNVNLPHPSEDITFNVAVGGTAANYAPVPASVTVPAGSGGFDIPVRVLDDAVGDGSDKTVTLDISGTLPDGWSFGTARHTVTIIDDEPGGLVEITNMPPHATLAESGTITIDVLATNSENFAAAASEDVTLEVELNAVGDPDILVSGYRNNPASANDYTLGSLVLDRETGTGSFTFTVEDDDIAEGREIVTLALKDPDGNLPSGWRIPGVMSQFTVTVPASDNAVRFSEWPRNDPGSFAGLSATVREGETDNLPHLNILIDHIAPGEGLPLLVSVPDEYMDDIELEIPGHERAEWNSANNNFLFLRNGNINQAPNLAASLRIRAVDDDEPEPEETFDITLVELPGFPGEWGGVANASDTGVPTLATSTSFSVTIPANDNSVSFARSGPAKVPESIGTVDISINLTNDAPAGGLPLTLTMAGDTDTVSFDENLPAVTTHDFFVSEGATGKQVAVYIQPDDDDTPESVFFTLAPGPGFPAEWGDFPPGGITSLNITELYAGGNLSFASSASRVSEPASASVSHSVAVHVKGTLPPGGFPLAIAVGGASTADGSDYSALQTLSNVLVDDTTVADGVLTLDFSILPDDVPEANETIRLFIPPGQTLPDGWWVFSPSFHIITIPANENTVSFADAASRAAENAGTHSIPVRLDSAFSRPVTLTITAEGDATNGTDYTLDSQIVLPANSATANVAVPLVSDDLFETDEHIDLTIGGVLPRGWVFGGTTHRVTIVNDDIGGFVEVASTPPSATLAEPGMVTVNVLVTNSEDFAAATSEDVVLDVEISAAGDPDISSVHRNNPVSANDYAVGELVLDQETGRGSFTFTVEDDDVAEGREIVTLALKDPDGNLPHGWLVSDASSRFTVTVPGNDNAMRFSEWPRNDPGSFAKLSATVAEGENGNLPYLNLFIDHVAPAGGLPFLVTPPVEYINDVVFEAHDYARIRPLNGDGIFSFRGRANVNGAPNLAAGLKVRAVDDDKPEWEETFDVTLAELPGFPFPVEWGRIANAPDAGSPAVETSLTFSVTIPASDNTVSFVDTAGRVAENAGTHNVPINVHLAFPEPVTLTVATGGDATNGVDYTVDSQIVVPANSATANIAVTLIPDEVAETDEYIDLTIGGTLPDGWSLDNATYRITILDGEPAGFVEVANTSTSAMLAEPGMVTVDVAVTNSEDFAAATSENVVLDVELTAAGDPDVPPARRNNPVSANDYTVGELVIDHETGRGSFTFTVEDDDIPEGREIITLALADTDGNLPRGWLVSDAKDRFTVTVPANDNAAQFTKLLVADTGQFSEFSATVEEGETEGLPQLNILIDHIAPDQGLPFVISMPDEYAADIGLENIDNRKSIWDSANRRFIFLRGGDIDREPNLLASLRLFAEEDDEPELTEEFFIRLKEFPGFPYEWGYVRQTFKKVAGTGTLFSVTIPANDNTVSFAETAGRAAENAGTYNVPINVHLASPEPITLTVTAAGSATNGTDYTVDSEIVLPVDSATANLAVTLIPDEVAETDEYIDLTIGGTLPDGWSLDNATHRVTITNEEPRGLVEVANTSTSATLAEPGSVTVNVAVTNSEDFATATSEDVVLDVELAAAGDPDVPPARRNNPVSANDYTVGELVVDRETGRGSFTFTVEDDDIAEGREIITLALADPDGNLPHGWLVSDAGSRFTVTIPANDNTAAFTTTNSVSVAENAGTMDLTINLTNAAPAGGLPLVLTASGDTDAVSFDETNPRAATRAFSVAAGASSGQVTVYIRPDDNAYPESVTFTLTAGSDFPTGWGGVPDGETFTLAVTESEPPGGTLAFALPGSEFAEPASGSASHSVAVNVVGTLPRGGFPLVVTVDAASTAGDFDYSVLPALSNVLVDGATVTDGVLTLDFSILADDVPEMDETIVLSISADQTLPDGWSVVSPSTHTISIPDNDDFTSSSGEADTELTRRTQTGQRRRTGQ